MNILQPPDEKRAELYETMSPQADKLLAPDGSIASRNGNIVQPPDPERAAMYESMMPQAAKYLLPNGSITSEIGGGGGSGGSTDIANAPGSIVLPVGTMPVSESIQSLRDNAKALFENMPFRGEYRGLSSTAAETAEKIVTIAGLTTADHPAVFSGIGGEIVTNESVADKTVTVAELSPAYPYGFSATAAGTQNKAVTIAGLSLVDGTLFAVAFNATNTHATPQLNVNGTGARAITLNGFTMTAGVFCVFQYSEGDNRFIITAQTPLPFPDGMLFGVRFASGNTVANPTLNLNGTFPRPMFSGDIQMTAGDFGRNRWNVFSYNATLDRFDLVTQTPTAVPVEGQLFSVEFSNADTSGSPALNLNNSGYALPMYDNGAAMTELETGKGYVFAYNGAENRFDLLYATLASGLDIVTGIMSSNGTMTLGFQPKLVFVFATQFRGSFNTNNGIAMAVQGLPQQYAESSTTFIQLEITANGFSTARMTGAYGLSSPTTEMPLRYVAFR